MPSGDCFHCHQPGHWANRCPLKTPSKLTAVADADVASPPVIHCPCDGGSCDVLTSKTDKNPNRRFYKCSAVPSCGFFKWCDQVSIKSQPISVNPTCPCGSGPCRRVTVIDGPNADRSYFVCCIKKGFGACGFFQWEDDTQTPPEPKEEEEEGHGTSPCSTLIGFSDFDFADDENLDSNVKNSSLVDVIAQPVKDYADTLPMNAVTLEKESVSNGVFASVDGRNKVYEDSVRLETEEQVLPSLSPKHIEPQVEDLCTKSALLGFRGKEIYASEVVEAMCVLGANGLPQNISKSGSNDINRPEHQSTTSGETGALFSGSSFLMDLIKQYNSEKLNFESVSMKHVDALTVFTGSYKQLESLRDREHSLRKQLLEVEKQVKICKAETSEFATSLREVSGEMVKSQKKMVDTAKKVAKVVSVYKEIDFADL